MGVLESIDTIVDIILNELSKNSYFRYEGVYLNKKIKIDCFLKTPDNYHQELDASFSVSDPDNFEFKIEICRLDRSLLKHELKHMDRVIRRNAKTDTYYYINHVGRHVSSNYEYLFKDKDHFYYFIDTLYFCNPDEFEAYFNDLYEKLKLLIDDDMENIEKRKIIDYELENSNIYGYFSFYNKNKFDLLDFFKSKEDCNFFLKQFFIYQDKYFNDLDINISKFDKIKGWFKSNLLNKISKDKNIESGYSEINYYINKIVRNNYNKFGRIYSLFIN